MSTLSFRKSTESYDGILTSLNDLKDQISQDILSSKKIVIKINFVSTLKKLATTPVEGVKAFIDFTEDMGYDGKIIITETATQGLTKMGFNQFGWHDLEKKYSNVEIFDLKRDRSYQVNLIDTHGEEFPVEYSKLIKDSDYVVSACRAKTHNEVGITLAIKNLAVGGIINHRSKVHQGKNIHKNLELLTKFRKPDLCIVDGVVGMQGNGPISGDPINSEWVIASDDCVAVDSLGAELMGFYLKDAAYIKLCAESGLGKLYSNNEVIIKGDDYSDISTNFKTHKNFDSQPKL